MIERRDCSFADLGLTLVEGRSLLAKVQAELVSKQVEGWLSGQTHCRCCGAALSHKDSRSTVVRTVYVKVTANSPRLAWGLARQPGTAGTSRGSKYANLFSSSQTILSERFCFSHRMARRLSRDKSWA